MNVRHRLLAAHEQIGVGKKFLTLLAVVAGLSSAHAARAADPPPPARYFDNAGRSDVLSGGVRTIEVQTAKGKFKVWTKARWQQSADQAALAARRAGGHARVL